MIELPLGKTCGCPCRYERVVWPIGHEDVKLNF